MSDNVFDNQKEIAELERRIRALRRDGQVADTPAALSAHSLLKGIQAQLLKSVYDVRHNTELLQEMAVQESASQLLASTDSATSRIQNLLHPVFDLMSMEEGSFKPNSQPYSLHSIANESVLYARSFLGESAQLTFDVDLHCDDLIIACDAERFRDLLSHTAVFLALSLKKGHLRLSIDTRQSGQTAKVEWAISLSDYELLWDLPTPVSLDVPGHDGTGERALLLNYVHGLCAHLNSEVSLQDVPPGVRILHQVNVLHAVSPLPSGRVDANWSDRPVLTLDSLPDNFRPLSADVIRASDDDELDEIIRTTNPGLLVLHHFPHSPASTVTRNIKRAHSSGLPVLLRAAGIGFQDFANYRESVDAIVTEPCDEETLARYVIGLSLNDRRIRRRPAPLH